jgi:hypothetical protein
MSNGTSGGTAIPGEIDFDAIGRALVLALLSPGAGDGPDQSVVRDAGHYFGQSLGLAFDLLVEAQVAATQEDAVRTVLALPAEDYPTTADLVSAAAAVLALKVRDGTVALGEPADWTQYDDPAEPPLDQQDRKQLQQAGVQPTAAATGWSLQNAIQLLDACLDREDFNVGTWYSRYQWAATFSAVGLVADLTTLLENPTIEDGLQVHGVLQSRFREHYGPTPLRTAEILIERRIYRPSGDLTLAQAKFENARYRRLWLALRSPRFLRGSLRVDLADLTSMSLWEVKPLEGLAQGVAQLFYYTMAYQCLARVQSAPERLIASPMPLLPQVTRPVRLSPSAGGRQQFAMPFERREVPGLVGYVVVVFPRLQDLQNVLVLDLMRRLAKELRRLRGTQAPPNDDGLTAAMALAVVAFVLVVGLVAATGPAGIAAVGGAVVRALGPRVVGSLAGTLAGGLAGAAAGAEPPVPEAAAGSTGEAEPVTLLTFAGPIPCEDALQALAVLQALATVMFLGVSTDAGSR